MINPLASRSCHYTVARATIFRVLGNPNDIDNVPCDEELRVHVYEAKTISWKFWNKIKILLVKSLFREISNGEKSEFPKNP